MTRSVPLSFNRKAVIASARVNRRKSSFHALTEPDVHDARELLEKMGMKLGIKPSFTAFIAASLAKAVTEYPIMNAFIRRGRIILLDDITISILMEREINGELVPEPMVVRDCANKTYSAISDTIHKARENSSDRLGRLSDNRWFSLIPGFLLSLFIRIADKNTGLAKKYGKIAITAPGMFAPANTWFVPHGSPTLLVTVGSINKKPVLINGELREREHLSLTVSFDHDLIDGAPAARFLKRFSEILSSGEVLIQDESPLAHKQ